MLRETKEKSFCGSMTKTSASSAKVKKEKFKGVRPGESTEYLHGLECFRQVIIQAICISRASLKVTATSIVKHVGGGV